MNDINRAVSTNMDIISYADDTVALFHGRSWQETQQIAEQGVSSLKHWLDKNLLTLNINKTKYLCFHKTEASHPKTRFDIKLHSSCHPTSCICDTLEQVKSIKYLGIIVDDKLSFKPHITALSQRVRKMIFVMKLLRNSADLQTLKLVYSCLAESLLRYCISAWGGAGISTMIEIERAQRAVLKVMLRKYFQYPTTALYFDACVLNVRQLFMLTVGIRTHREIVNSSEYPRLLKNRVFKIPEPRVRTSFAQKFPAFLFPFIYNKLNKSCDIKLCTTSQAKQIIQKHLLSYNETENLLKITR